MYSIIADFRQNVKRIDRYPLFSPDGARKSRTVPRADVPAISAVRCRTDDIYMKGAGKTPGTQGRIREAAER